MQLNHRQQSKSIHFKTTLANSLIEGLQRIQNSKLALPLVPLGGNKQPLGDKWQNRPFTGEQLIEALATGGVSVPIKGQIKKIQLQGVTAHSPSKKAREIEDTGYLYHCPLINCQPEMVGDQFLV